MTEELGHWTYRGPSKPSVETILYPVYYPGTGSTSPRCPTQRLSAKRGAASTIFNDFGMSLIWLSHPKLYRHSALNICKLTGLSFKHWEHVSCFSWRSEETTELRGSGSISFLTMHGKIKICEHVSYSWRGPGNQFSHHARHQSLLHYVPRHWIQKIRPARWIIFLYAMLSYYFIELVYWMKYQNFQAPTSPGGCPVLVGRAFYWYVSCANALFLRWSQTLWCFHKSKQ